MVPALTVRRTDCHLERAGFLKLFLIMPLEGLNVRNKKVIRSCLDGSRHGF